MLSLHVSLETSVLSFQFLPGLTKHVSVIKYNCLSLNTNYLFNIKILHCHEHHISEFNKMCCLIEIKFFTGEIIDFVNPRHCFLQLLPEL